MTTPTGEAPKRRGERTDNSVKKLPNGEGWREMRYRAEQPDQTRISLMKVVELQRRGLPHFHAVIRLDAAPEAGRPPSVQTRL